MCVLCVAPVDIDIIVYPLPPPYLYLPCCIVCIVGLVVMMVLMMCSW